QPHHGTVLGEGGIGAGEDLVAALVAAQQEVGVAWLAALQYLRQRFDAGAGRQAGQFAAGGIEAAVGEYQARGGDARDHGRVERRRRGVGGREAAALERAQRGVLPGLLARARQAVGQQRLQRGAAAGAQFLRLRRAQGIEALAERFQQRGHYATCSGAIRSLSQA